MKTQVVYFVFAMILCVSASFAGLAQEEAYAEQTFGSHNDGKHERITISGNHFLKDGQPWVPKGIKVEAFNRPILPNLPDWANTSAQQARALYTEKELDVIRETFGADIIRFAVSQPGLDPNSPIYSEQYLHDLLAAIAAARSKGFIVIASMDNQAENDPAVPGNTLACMPNDSTVRAWKTLAPHLMDDQAVMFELFDEPCNGIDNNGAKKWAEGTQPIINAVRALGAKNILFIDGLHYARTTTGLFPLVHDEITNRLAFAVHPYLSQGWFVTAAQWDANFGKDAEHYPMLATEWNASSVGKCSGYDLPTTALNMIRYLENKSIGVIGWAIDSNAGKLVQDHINFIPTNYTHFTGCTPNPTPTDSGAGELIAHFPQPVDIKLNGTK